MATLIHEPSRDRLTTDIDILTALKDGDSYS